jgi:iron complex outermembrane receptor protein
MAAVSALAIAAGFAQSAMAQDAPNNNDATQVKEIVVTGSSIKRVDRETASPVQVLNSDDLKHSGYDTIAQVLTNVTANGTGTLSSNNSEAFAGGASGIALRGLSVGATLTLVDGHRLAPYPLSDDGERQFTDVSSIPFDAIDRVEVLKDGASAVYGSDAIAGVVNIILKKQLTGFQASAEGGMSEHGGGATKHFTLSLGKGDLSTDGYNAFVTAEYRSQDAIYLSQRSYQDWANPNFTGIGGNNLSPGAPNIFNSGLPATLTPYLVNPNGSLSSASSYDFLGSGCNYAKMTAAQCTYTPQAKLQSPTQNVNILGSFTKRFDGGFELNVKASFFDSKGQQNSSGPFGWASSYPGASFAGNTSNPIGGTPSLNVGAIPNFLVPANFPGNTLGVPAYLEGVIPQLGIPLINFDSKTYRIAADLTGQVAGWDVRASAGASKVDTDVTLLNFVNFDNLYTDLSNGSFNPLGGNSSAVMNFIAPQSSYTATDSLYYAELNASRTLLTWDGGDLAMAVGAEFVDKQLNNPGDAAVLAGQIGGTFSTYAIGSQTDTAEYMEVNARLFHSLELNAALRDDYYDTYGNSLTPKFGFKWRPNKKFALRGTYSEGFRAPTAAETGNSSTLFGLGLQFPDPILCGADHGMGYGQVPASCATAPGFDQRTNPLKPETSKSYTLGFVVEPIRNWSSTFDYYHIAIKDQIVTAAELSNYTLTSCERGAALPTQISDGHGGTITGIPLAGPITLCNSGYVNANSTTTSGFDFQTQYKFKFVGDSRITTSLSFTHILQYALTFNGQTYQLAGTHGPSGVSGDTGNPRDRANASVAFDKGPFDLALTANWISSFSVTDPSTIGGTDATCQGSLLASGPVFAGASSAPSSLCRVKSFTTVNMAANYQWSPHLTLKASIDNLLDANAPQDFQTYSGQFMPYNPNLHMDGVIGRFFRVGVAYKY